MKKSYNKLLIISIAFSVVIMVICYLSAKMPQLTFTQEAIDKVHQMNGAPGSGEFLLITLPITLLADFGSIFAIFIFNILLPGTTLLSIILLQIIARLFQIGDEKRWKNITSFIITILTSVTILSLLYILLMCIGALKYLAIMLGIVMIVLFIIELIKIGKNINKASEKNDMIKID